jgi:perosamine synthetase
LIVRSLGLGPGDEVLVPSFTFVASVNAILYEGATPVFVDIEPDTYNLDPDDLERKITPRTRAIMAVDVFGHPVEWGRILRVAKVYGLYLIDDACEALGAEYRGRRIGQFGDAAAFAFYPNKQLTTGEGGMIVTHNRKIAELVRSLCNQGRGAMGAWLEHERLGYNYRMNEMSAALGVSQLQRLPQVLAKRRNVAQMYHDRLQGCSWLRLPSSRPGVSVSWFVYVVTLGENIDRDQMISFLARHGVSTRAYFSPVHLQPYIQGILGYRGGELPVTEAVSRRTLALPFHNRLSEAEVQRVVAVLRKGVDEQTRRSATLGSVIRSTRKPTIPKPDTSGVPLEPVIAVVEP